MQFPRDFANPHSQENLPDSFDKQIPVDILQPRYRETWSSSPSLPKYFFRITTRDRAAAGDKARRGSAAMVGISVLDLREVRMNRMFGFAAAAAVALVLTVGGSAEARSCCRTAKVRCCKPARTRCCAAPKTCCAPAATCCGTAAATCTTGCTTGCAATPAAAAPAAAAPKEVSPAPQPPVETK